MVPPLGNVASYKDGVIAIARNYAKSIEATGVSHVVNLSSIGAHEPAGNGPSSIFYYEEKELYQMPGIQLLHLRAGMFYTNFYANMEMIRNGKVIARNFDGSIPMAFTHPHDLAAVAANALHTLSFKGKEVMYVVSDIATGNDVAHALGKATQQPELPWVKVTDEQMQQGIVQSGLPEQMASLFVELGQSISTGKMFSHFNESKAPVVGTRKLSDFAKEFEMVYQQQ